MHYAYAAADFAVCRSGAMTCAELAAVGMPAAYVPLPLRGGEQRHNAGPAVAAVGALLVDNTDLDNGLDRDHPEPGAHRSRADRRDPGPHVGGRGT
jgi:UDP-N-acetylglucosamine:LPS N-acetylglucosamine transferase